MSGAVPLPAGNLAAHPDKGEIFLDRALERAREFGDGVFGEVGANRGHDRSIVHPHMIAERGRKSDAGAGGGFGRSRARALLGDFGVAAGTPAVLCPRQRRDRRGSRMHRNRRDRHQGARRVLPQRADRFRRRRPRSAARPGARRRARSRRDRGLRSECGGLRNRGLEGVRQGSVRACANPDRRPPPVSRSGSGESLHCEPWRPDRRQGRRARGRQGRGRRR